MSENDIEKSWKRNQRGYQRDIELTSDEYASVSKWIKDGHYQGGDYRFLQIMLLRLLTAYDEYQRLFDLLTLAATEVRELRRELRDCESGTDHDDDDDLMLAQLVD